LTLQFFVETYDPTIEDSYRTRVIIDGLGCVLEILDTSHQEEYTALRDQWIRDGEGFVLVYSITKRSSFTRISRFYHQLKSVKEVQRSDPYGCCSAYAEQDLQPPVMLVGNNCERVTEREVSTEEGLALAQELGCEFVEASARNSINVDEAFFDVVRQIRRQRMAAAEQRRIAKASNPQERKILPPLVHNYPRKRKWGYIKRKE
jgi:GTPase KRas